MDYDGCLPAPSDREVIGVMVDGGKKLCDYAIECWSSNKYGMDHDTNYAYIKRWKFIKSRVAELGSLLREAIRESS